MIYWLNRLFRSTSNSRGDCGAIFQTLGLAIPPALVSIADEVVE